MRFQPSGDVPRTGARVVAVARMTASAACLYTRPDGMPSFGGPAWSVAARGRERAHVRPTRSRRRSAPSRARRRRPAARSAPSASGCQNVASSTVEPGTPTMSGWFRRDVARVGVVQRLVRPVAPAGGDRGRADAVAGGGGRGVRGGRVVRGEAQRAHASREQPERPAEIRVERRAPEEEPVRGVADRDGRMRRGVCVRHRGGHVEEVARLHRLGCVPGAQHVDGRLVPERRHRPGGSGGRARGDAVRRGGGNADRRQRRHRHRHDPVGGDAAQAALSAPRIADGQASDASSRRRGRSGRAGPPTRGSCCPPEPCARASARPRAWR